MVNNHLLINPKDLQLDLSHSLQLFSMALIVWALILNVAHPLPLNVMFTVVSHLFHLISLPEKSSSEEEFVCNRGYTTNGPCLKKERSSWDALVVL